tara:strand:- start:87 stop:563 length:477 start_codon:yes stop_codon:yes gene_type:complete
MVERIYKEKKLKKIFLATDHAGFKLKEIVREYLLNLNYEIIDCGAYKFDPEDDYPDFISKAAYKVSQEKKSVGIIFGGSGQGEAIVANRFKGVRAIVFYDGLDEIIKLSRQHNDANIISIGARFIDSDRAIEILNIWLRENFDGGRHERRIKKIDKIC